MKFFSALTYDINLDNRNIDCINQVTKTFGKVFRGIYLQLVYPQDKLEEI